MLSIIVIIVIIITIFIAIIIVTFKMESEVVSGECLDHEHQLEINQWCFHP